MKGPLYIFDLDGTLADHRHRLPLIGSGSDEEWMRYHRACLDDEVIAPVMEVLRTLNRHCEVWIWTGRDETVREPTRTWLFLGSQIFGIECLRMREHGDHRPDYKLKEEWLLAMSAEDRARLVCVFEDRDRVVKMWRDNGVPCFQVAPGDF